MSDTATDTAPEAGNEADTGQISTLPPAAQRALAEAEARRKAAGEQVVPKEYGGRDGLEPVRYGDWEKKGLAVDF